MPVRSNPEADWGCQQCYMAQNSKGSVYGYKHNALWSIFCYCIFRQGYRIKYVFLMVSRVLCLATVWTTGQSRFDPLQRRKDFSSSLCVQTGFAAHLASCPVGTGGILSPGLKCGRGVTLNTHLQLVPRSRMSRSHTSSSHMRLRGVWWDCFSFYDILLRLVAKPTTLCCRLISWGGKILKSNVFGYRHHLLK
jgi:hypothetical protein